MKIHIEENDKPLTKGQVELLTKNEPTGFKVIVCSSNPTIKIPLNDKGIWRRILMPRKENKDE